MQAVIDLAVKEIRPDGWISYTIAASQLYPAMLQLLGDAAQRVEFADAEAQRHYARRVAQARASSGLADAAVPHDQTLTWPAERRGQRAYVLETCRLWFTAALHKQLEQGLIALHITVDTAPCDNCGGTGKVYAGKQEIVCPACGGAKQIKVESPWRL